MSTLRQAAVPDELLGRVTAGYRLIVLGAVPVGALLGGALARWQGTESTFVASAIGLTLAALVFASRVTTRALREAEETVHATTTGGVAYGVPAKGGSERTPSGESEDVTHHN